MCNILNIFQPCLMKLHRLGWKVSWHWPEILQKIRNQYEIKFLQTINTEGCIISPFYIVILAKDQLVVYTTSDLSLLFSVFFIRSINTNPTLFLSSVSTIRLRLLLLILLQIERKKKKQDSIFFTFFTMRYRFNASNPILHPTRFFFYFLLYLKKKNFFYYDFGFFFSWPFIGNCGQSGLIKTKWFLFLTNVYEMIWKLSVPTVVHFRQWRRLQVRCWIGRDLGILNPLSASLTRDCLSIHVWNFHHSNYLSLPVPVAMIFQIRAPLRIHCNGHRNWYLEVCRYVARECQVQSIADDQNHLIECKKKK